MTIQAQVELETLILRTRSARDQYREMTDKAYEAAVQLEMVPGFFRRLFRLRPKTREEAIDHIEHGMTPLDYIVTMSDYTVCLTVSKKLDKDLRVLESLRGVTDTVMVTV